MKRSADTLRHISAFFANLTSLPQHHGVLHASGCVRLLFAMVEAADRQRDNTIALNAVRALANLALSRELHAPLLEGGALKQTLVYLKWKEMPQWCVRVIHDSFFVFAG